MWRFHQRGWLHERSQDELTGFDDGRFTIPFAQRVVIETLELMHFLDARSEAMEKLHLRLFVYHPVVARNQHLGRHVNGLGIAHHARRCLIHFKKNLD